MNNNYCICHIDLKHSVYKYQQVGKSNAILGAESSGTRPLASKPKHSELSSHGKLNE